MLEIRGPVLNFEVGDSCRVRQHVDIGTKPNNMASICLTAQKGTHPCPSLNTWRGLAPKENQNSFPSMYSGRGRGGYFKTGYIRNPYFRLL